MSHKFGKRKRTVFWNGKRKIRFFVQARNGELDPQFTCPPQKSRADVWTRRISRYLHKTHTGEKKWYQFVNTVIYVVVWSNGCTESVFTCKKSKKKQQNNVWCLFKFNITDMKKTSFEVVLVSLLLSLRIFLVFLLLTLRT